MSSAPFPSLTKTWHSSSYAAIDPSRPELSAKDKTILVTGGGSGIGAAIAIAFAKAGAPRIALIGRTKNSLEETKATINAAYKSTEVVVATGDIADKASIEKAFSVAVAALGNIDVFVSNAGYLSESARVAQLDGEDWWTGFKINVLGSLNAVQAFLPRATPNAYIINISSGVVHFPAIPGLSGYATSKLAGTKLLDFVQAENPSLTVFNVHPGVVLTDINIKSGIPAMDDVALPADFSVWLTSPEAKFLKGKFVYANWDVDEMKAMAKDIEGGSLITMGLYGIEAADVSSFA